MTRYQELLQQQKGWESAIADKDAAKVLIPKNAYGAYLLPTDIVLLSYNL